MYKRSIYNSEALPNLSFGPLVSTIRACLWTRVEYPKKNQYHQTTKRQLYQLQSHDQHRPRRTPTRPNQLLVNSKAKGTKGVITVNSTPISLLHYKRSGRRAAPK